MGTRGFPEWHPELVVPLVRGLSEPSVGEGRKRWERLPPTVIRSHKGKAIKID